LDELTERRRVAVANGLLEAVHESRDSVVLLNSRRGAQSVRREDGKRQAQKEGANSHVRYGY
jgi:hypothetical protein